MSLRLEPSIRHTRVSFLCWSAGEVDFGRGLESTFGGSSQGISQCEVDSNESRVEGRTGVHVESEVVLKCEGNNEGAYDMLRCEE